MSIERIKSEKSEAPVVKLVQVEVSRRLESSTSSDKCKTVRIDVPLHPA